MLEEIKAFLASSPVFAEVPAEQLDELAPLFQIVSFRAGALVLQQGVHSEAVYFVRSGRLAVRVQRGEWRETVAFVHPPDILGELSFVTGRPCSADVEVVVDAELLVLPKSAVPKLPQHREAILRGLMRAIAERLHSTVTHGTKVPSSPVVLLRSGSNWEAKRSFPAALLDSLAFQTGRSTLLVRIDAGPDEEPKAVGEHASVAALHMQTDAEGIRAHTAGKLAAWKRQFDQVLLAPLGPGTSATIKEIEGFADIQGYLLGPGDPEPGGVKDSDFVVQSAAQPTLAMLSARRQLIFDEGGPEKQLPPSARFQRTVDSIARAIGGIQVGLALGGGAAWGWAHIGVIAALEKAGVPIDIVSGCSMGSLIGALYSAGKSTAEMAEVAEYWRTRTRKFIEWRFWRMCLLNENVVRRVFVQYFGDRTVNQAEIPYWANAVDIQTGREFTIRDGTLIDCVRASIALPGLMSPAKRDTKLLVDAGIMNPVPVHLVREMGCQYSVAVNAMAAIENQKMNPRYPFNAFDVMTRCMFVMGHEIGQARAEQVADVVFTPTLGEITMLQFARCPEIIECGRVAAEAYLEAIQAGYSRLKRSRLSPEATKPPAGL